MARLTFHHVAIGVTHFDRAIETYEALGHRLHLKIDDPGLNVRVAFVSLPNGPWIEIVAPLNPGGPLDALLVRKALPAPYHTCYGVDDLAVAANDLRNLRFMPMGSAHPALAFENCSVQFFYNATIGLIELVERPPVWPFSGG